MLAYPEVQDGRTLSSTKYLLSPPYIPTIVKETLRWSLTVPFDDRVPDHQADRPISRLVKILQQGSHWQLLQYRSSRVLAMPITLTRSDNRSTPLRCKAEGEEVGSTVPLLALLRERFSYWCPDLLFFIYSDTAKGISTRLDVCL